MSNHRIIQGIFSFALLAGLASTGWAAPGTDAGLPHLMRWDTNRDGRLSRAEFDEGRKAKRAAKFEEADANRDGVLDRAEFQTVVQCKMKGKGHKAHRKNAQGKKDRSSKFDRLDTNGDGYLDPSEIPHRKSDGTEKDHRHGKSKRRAQR